MAQTNLRLVDEKGDKGVDKGKALDAALSQIEKRRRFMEEKRK